MIEQRVINEPFVPTEPVGESSSTWTASRAAVVAISPALVAVAVVAALEIGNATAWSTVGVVVAWSLAASVVVTRRRSSDMGIVTSLVPAAVALAAVSTAFIDDGLIEVGRALAVAAIPTSFGLLLTRSPNGGFTTPVTRIAGWVVGALGASLGIALIVDAPDVAPGPMWAGSIAIGAVAASTVARACGGVSVVDRARLQWIGWGVTIAVGVAVGVVALVAIIDWPDPADPVLVFAGALPALGLAISAYRRSLGVVGQVLVATIVTFGMLAFVAAVYLVVVLGLHGSPDEGERAVLGLSLLAALVVAVTGFAVQRRLHELAVRRVYGDEGEAADQALETFATRMSRAVPMDELLLQLVESLRKTMKLTSAEVWTGSDGRFDLTVSVPHREGTRLTLGPESLSVATRAHVQGNAWLAVWVPELLVDRVDRAVRLTSVAHLGELLGFIVTERPASAVALDEEDEHRVLVDIARQLGLALHNVRLDNALQASLDELQVANDELVASRARIVAATDESRRRIERNLHDGAQQHLVALAVKVGLVRQLLESDPTTAHALLDELRGDVQATLTELRELAHGIYPPRLRDRGLRDALGAAADRASLPTTVEAEELGRYGPDVETAVYFCCLEAIQNAGKHAGEGATIVVALAEIDGALVFTVSDDGVGFDPAEVVESHGFVNMRDRLGAFAGVLTVTSGSGTGTTIRGSIPLS